MSKPLPTSKIPKTPGFIEPVITKVTKTLPHYEVNSEVFLVKSRATKAAKLTGVKPVILESPIEVFEVTGGHYFVTEEEALKKQKSILKSHRDTVREASKIFSITKASLAEKNSDMKWLLEVYGAEKILEAYTVFTNTSGYPWSYIQTPQMSIRSERQDLFFKNRDLNWSWLKDRKLDRYRNIPIEHSEVGEKRDKWREREHIFIDKITSISDLINRRVLELTVKTAKENADYDESGEVISVIPFEWLMELVDKRLVIEELEDIRASFDSEELGEALIVKKIPGGEVVYHLKDSPKELNPFKKF